MIAKEFGYSETVFVHDSPGAGMPRRVEIFTEKGEEVPFAGHPVSAPISNHNANVNLVRS